MKGYGRLIAEARNEKGMTAEELAERLGKGKAIVYRWEAELQEPTIEQVNKLVSVLPLSTEQLLVAMGANLSPRAAANLPRPLINKLLALSPERLHALAELLPDPER